MHMTNQNFSFHSRIGRALIAAGSEEIRNECKTLGQPALFTAQYTSGEKLKVKEIAHVIGPSYPTLPEFQQCLENFFKNIPTNLPKIWLGQLELGQLA